MSFLKADSCPPIQVFQKAKEHKDRGWCVTSCNFRLPVKNNFSTCVVLCVCVCSFYRMRVEHMQIGSYRCNKVALMNYEGIVVNGYFFSEGNY